jgi:ABC-2 type transport system permease protein
MNKALVVAKWEYVERLKSKMFLISLFIFPVIIVAFAILPTFLMSRMEDSQKTIGLIDPENKLTPTLIRKIEGRFTLKDDQPMYEIRKIDEPAADVETLRMIGNSLVFADVIAGYLYIPPDVFETNQPEYYSTNVGNIQDHSRFAAVIRDVLTEYRLEERGVDPGIVNEVVKPVNLRTVRISPTGEERESGFLEIFWSSYIFLMAMMMLIATSGQILIRSVVEEKTNRIIEVLASSCSATDLMTGKILGLSALGLTQIGLYTLMGVAAVSYFGIEGLEFENVWLLLPYFILGYLFYAAIFVVVGSPLSSEHEAQQVTSWIILLLMIPFVFAFIAIENPGMPVIRFLSFIPFFTPSLMALRIPIVMPPVSDIVATLGILVICTAVMMWIAGKIFRVAILSYGKRPSVGEIVRWVKSG